MLRNGKMPPQPSGVPPDFDRFPPPWLVQAHTHSYGSASAQMPRWLRGFAGLRPQCRSPQNARSRALRSHAAAANHHGADAPRFLGGQRCRRLRGNTPPCRATDESWWQSHGALIAPYEGIFPCRRKNTLLVTQHHTACGLPLISLCGQSRQRSRFRSAAVARPEFAPTQSSRSLKLRRAIAISILSANVGFVPEV